MHLSLTPPYALWLVWFVDNLQLNSCPVISLVRGSCPSKLPPRNWLYWLQRTNSLVPTGNIFKVPSQVWTPQEIGWGLCCFWIPFFYSAFSISSYMFFLGVIKPFVCRVLSQRLFFGHLFLRKWVPGEAQGSKLKGEFGSVTLWPAISQGAPHYGKQVGIQHLVPCSSAFVSNFTGRTWDETLGRKWFNTCNILGVWGKL